MNRIREKARRNTSAVIKRDFPVGKYRRLTIVSPEDPDGTELCLEPNDTPAAGNYRQAIFARGIPADIIAGFENDAPGISPKRMTPCCRICFRARAIRRVKEFISPDLSTPTKNNPTPDAPFRDHPLI